MSIETYKLAEDKAAALEKDLNLLKDETANTLKEDFKAAVEGLDQVKVAEQLKKQFFDGEKVLSTSEIQNKSSYTFLVQTALDSVSKDNRYEMFLRGKDDAWGIDAKYGQRTRNAVRQFQTDASIKVDGIAGEETIQTMYEVLTGTKTLDFTNPLIDTQEVYDIKQNSAATEEFPAKTQEDIITGEYKATVTKTVDNITSVWKGTFKDGNLVDGQVFDGQGTLIATYEGGKQIEKESNNNAGVPEIQSLPTFTAEELKNTPDEEVYAADAKRQNILFMNARQAQAKGFVDADGNLLQPDFYERVEADSDINFAVKEKPLDGYLVKYGWEKIEGDTKHYKKDINNDGVIDVVPTQLALFIQKNNIVLDASVPVVCYDPVPNSIYYSKGGFSTFAIDFDVNTSISLDILKPYIADKNYSLSWALGKTSKPSFVHMENEKLIGLKVDTIISRQVPKSLTFLGAEKCQIPLDTIPSITHIWDYDTQQKVAIPEDRKDYVYENGRLININENPSTSVLYTMLNDILHGKDAKGWDQTVQQQRGNIEVVSQDGRDGLSSYGYETYVDLFDGGYRLSGIVDKKFTFTDIRELYQTLNLINKIKHDYLYNETYKNKPIIFENNEIQIDDGTLYDTTIVSQNALTNTFPTVKKYVNQFVAYLNKQKEIVI